VERLVRLGLTLYEARAYVALVRRAKDGGLRVRGYLSMIVADPWDGPTPHAVVADPTGGVWVSLWGSDQVVNVSADGDSLVLG